MPTSLISIIILFDEDFKYYGNDVKLRGFDAVNGEPHRAQFC
jgi:hypothetical protein